ncbi:MAG: DUF455 family protein [Burkholderiales bacterium]|nr:DUF455 family protein [Burkholderiales bacterium]
MRALDATLAFVAGTADAFAWHAGLLSRWIIEAGLPQTKIGLGRDLHRLALWTEQLLQRSRELGVDINERSLRRGAAARAAAERLRSAAAAGTNVALHRALEGSLQDTVERAASQPAVLDEPTRELFAAMSASLHRAPLHRVDAEEPGLWPLREGVPAEAASLGELAGVTPGRSARLFRGTEPAQPFEPATDARASAIAFLHHNLTELELPTMESCCRLLLECDMLPWAFAADMARQCWDEARHAQAFMQRLQQLGGEVGCHAHTHQLWEMTADLPPAVRLAVHQRIGEWVGVDGALWNAERFRRLGDEATADALDFIARDEITHVAFGNRWIRWLHPSDAEVEAVAAEALKRRRAFGKPVDGPAVFPFNRWACERAGFTADEVQALEREALARGSRFERFEP